MKVSEPAVAYNTTYLQGLKNRLIASIDASTDEETLEQCLLLLDASSKDLCYDDGLLMNFKQWHVSEKGGFARQRGCLVGSFLYL